MATGPAALFCLCLVLLVTGGTSQSSQCAQAPWQSHLGENPITANAGKVVLVALVKGYCRYCVGQARSLVRLKAHLARHNMPDIAMILVNGGEPISRDNIANLQNAAPSLTTLQDTENHVMYNNIFQGNKDDFIVYDRCGNRAVYIPHPASYLGYTITERVLRAVYRGGSVCSCSYNNNNNNNNNMQSDDPHDRMQGDQPVSVSGYGAGAGGLDLQCPRTDRMCRRFQNQMGSQQDRFSNRPWLRMRERPSGSGYVGRHRGGRRRGGHHGHGGGSRSRPHHHHHRGRQHRRGRTGGTV